MYWTQKEKEPKNQCEELFIHSWYLLLHRYYSKHVDPSPGHGHCKALWSPSLCLPLGKLSKAHLVTDEYDIFDLVVEMNIKNM